MYVRYFNGLQRYPKKQNNAAQPVRASHRDQELSWGWIHAALFARTKAKPTLKFRLEEEVILKTVEVETLLRHGVRVP